MSQALPVTRYLAITDMFVIVLRIITLGRFYKLALMGFCSIFEQISL